MSSLTDELSQVAAASFLFAVIDRLESSLQNFKQSFVANPY